MRKLLAALFFLFGTPALAGVPCTPMPFNLQNGQVADATQVMANFNFIAGIGGSTCLANAASAGVNNDITALAGLTTPVPPSLGGTSAFIAQSASTGTPNAQVITTTLPTYLQTVLTKVVFLAGFSNTGAMTLQVGSTPTLSVFRRTTDGLKPLAGGEIIAGAVTEVVYDGTQYQLVSNISPFPVGTILDTIAQSAADAGFLLLNGQCASTTTFAALWTKMNSPGTGGCGAGQFPLPDARGRVLAMVDSGGSTNLATICTSGTFYSVCGNQQYTLTQANLPNVAPTSTVTITDPGHVHTYTAPNTATTPNYLAGSTSTPFASTVVPNSTAGTNTSNVTTGITAGATVSSINGNVTQTASTTVQPTLMINKQIKY